MRFRIKKEVNSVTGAVRFRPQISNIFWWTTLRRELGWNCDEAIICDSEEEAQREIDKRKAEQAWQ